MDNLLYGIPVAALVVALVQVAKESGLPGRLAPVASLVIGVAAGIALQFAQPHPDWLQGVVTGIAVGLSASGLYSSVSAFSTPTIAPLAAFTSTIQSTTPADPAPPTT